jgi:hypothetical protein
MSKVYVFGIGGTGARALRSLTMLLASGVECKTDIVPIIIDPDASSGDVNRTVELMKKYGKIHDQLKTTRSRFFKTGIKETIPNFRLPLSNTKDKLFDAYMNVGGMSRENQALVNMLFSQKNLNSDMKIGFKGNPNVGSVVLNQFDGSLAFRNFANDFDAQDKIFIISSIFGGTGASGFPLLLKTLCENNDIANQNYIRDAHIGAITVLPYFQVRQDETNSQIDSTTFISKAKSALAYYERNISNDSIDTLYYVGDDIRKTYENHEGGKEQKNDAHFVELITALALIDFAKSPKPERPRNTVHKEFGINPYNENKGITFDDLGYNTKNTLRKAMVQFNLFAKYLTENENLRFLRQPWAKNRRINRLFFKGDFMCTLKEIQEDYLNWLSEMAGQDRAFSPFDLHSNPKKVFDLVEGVNPKRLAKELLDSNYHLFNNRLNGQSGQSKTGSKEQQFVELFYLATQQLVKEKFNIK